MKPITKLNKETNEVKPLTLKEFELVLNSTKDEYKLIYAIAGLLGLRQTEILYIKLEDIDFNNKILNYRVAKSDEVTFKYLPEQLISMISDLAKLRGLKSDEFLFQVKKGKYYGNRIKEDTISKNTNILFKKLGIGKPRKNRKVLSDKNPIKNAIIMDKTFHSLRHTFGTEVWNICEDDSITARSLRHTRGNLETVKVYREIAIQKRELEYSNEIIKRLNDITTNLSSQV